MTLYMLDTDTCAFVMRGPTKALRRKLLATPLDQQSISVVTLTERLYGARVSARPDHNGAVLRDFVCYVAVRHWDESAIDHHAEIPCAPQVQRADGRRKRPDGRRSCPQSLGGHRDEQRAEIRARARTPGRKLGVTRHIGFVAKAATGAAKESGHPGGPERRSRSIGTPCAEGRRKRHGGSGPCSPIS
ncbi:type II toxin-antitoxin system VapC family toxin [Pelomicrobium methylotrophicum]|uniref:Type II toxin-antitoxin system VapC family toxin n=1 Tax=Pelomicrobium methylotrophicum TaxID=2602750 RepID=A0A5C7EG48_9PROT|nr:type II toxin-antitoxin system VapC family toxin [Pelomicrobium methylotrophicum]TXF09978.1 type II toxin-antitoxin system VapC family toxin [Pelomicrobium methylotrophicum]